MPDLTKLKELLAATRADGAYAQEKAQLTKRRQSIAPEIAELLDRFLSKAIDVEALRSTFDSKTRKEWDGFGLKGTSGAMLLNAMVKHLGNQKPELENRLRAALPPPADDHDAGARMGAFQRWLSSLIEAGSVTNAQIQPSRVPFFLSALWSIKRSDQPVFYESMRGRLTDLGLFRESNNLVESYLEFCRVVRDLRDQLRISPWDLEYACRYQPAPATPTEAAGRPGARVWLWAAGRNATDWQLFQRDKIAGIGWQLGDLTKFGTIEDVRTALQRLRGDDKKPVNDALACWQIAHDVQPGDTVYVKKGRFSVVGRGTVVSAYQHEPGRNPYPHLCEVNWDWTGEVRTETRLAMKTLTNVSDFKDLVAELRRAITATTPTTAPDDDETEDEAEEGPTYEVEDAAAELFMPRAELEELVDLLRRKKNVILQGPPGTGKTLVASRLADLILGRHAPEHVAFVQFHPSYGYEDFVQGYRPAAGGGYSRQEGPFLQICKQALQDPKDVYVLVIDEINRAHLGKVLGELMMLVEADKRDPRWAVRMTYALPTEQPFYIPENLFIIGTMNTADRSLAVVDYALRRRFAFYDLEPAFEEKAFEEHLVGNGATVDTVKKIRTRAARVNEMLAKDPALGPGYQLGHSFFCGPSAGDEGWFDAIIRFELKPLLQEYWFDRRDQVERALAILEGDG
jgi:MoxR-like ATPase